MIGQPRNTTTQATKDLGPRSTVFGAAILVALAWITYRPQTQRPFHFADFADFLPLLERQSGVMDGARALLVHYMKEGRFNPVSVALLAFKWELFGWWTPGWYLARAIVMSSLFALGYVLLRRLGGSRLGSLVGSTVFLWAPPAADGWLYLTMAEPLGAALTLLLSIRALRYQSSKFWRRDVLFFTLGTVALLLTKELLAPLIFFPLALATCTTDDGSFAFPQWNERSRALISVVGIGLAVACVPVVVTYLTADLSSYASQFGSTLQPPHVLFAIWIIGLVPFELLVHPTHTTWGLAIIGFTVLFAAGWRLGWRQDPVRARWLLILATGIPLLGVLAYLPTPWYMRFYTLPYLIGPLVILGMGASYLQAWSRMGSSLAGICWTGMTLFAVGSAFTLASRVTAAQRRDDELASFIADLNTVDVVYFTTSRHTRLDSDSAAGNAWNARGFGPTLRRFALATHRSWPSVREYTCVEAKRALGETRVLVVIDVEDQCGLQGHELSRIVVPYRSVDWANWRLMSDSTVARISSPVP